MYYNIRIMQGFCFLLGGVLEGKVAIKTVFKKKIGAPPEQAIQAKRYAWTLLEGENQQRNNVLRKIHSFPVDL